MGEPDNAMTMSTVALIASTSIWLYQSRVLGTWLLMKASAWDSMSSTSTPLSDSAKRAGTLSAVSRYESSPRTFRSEMLMISPVYLPSTTLCSARYSWKLRMMNPLRRVPSMSKRAQLSIPSIPVQSCLNLLIGFYWCRWGLVYG